VRRAYDSALKLPVIWKDAEKQGGARGGTFRPRRAYSHHQAAAEPASIVLVVINQIRGPIMIAAAFLAAHRLS
jgi:hypothetical protein